MLPGRSDVTLDASSNSKGVPVTIDAANRQQAFSTAIDNVTFSTNSRGTTIACPSVTLAANNAGTTITNSAGVAVIMPAAGGVGIELPAAPAIATNLTPAPKTGKQGKRKLWPDEHDANEAKRKLLNPSQTPYMTAAEAAAALGISIRAVYEHPLLEKSPTGVKKWLCTTASVLAVKNSLR